MTREVLYERNVTGSYMKVPMAMEGKLDEKIMLRKKLPGLLSVEKIFVNQGAWYWYDISGHQSLDHYCRVKPLQEELLENIITSICREIEIMKQNYMSPNCLVLDSEYIFISNQTGQIVFMVYPGESESLEKALQLLMEYLLTKIDHKDVEAVRKAYGIYEKTLDEAYTLEAIRDSLIAEKQEEDHEENERFCDRSETGESEILQSEVVRQKSLWKKPVWKDVQSESDSTVTKLCEDKKNEKSTAAQQKFEELIKQLKNWKESIKSRFSDINKEVIKPKFCKSEQSEKEREEKRRRSIVVMPEDLSEECEDEIMETIHPTICLSDYREHPRGLLLYEGTEDFGNIMLNSRDQQIGKSKEATICIEKATISSLHAGIWFEEQEYYLEDYNSTNGTYINNEPLAYKERRKLKCNDIVRFADVKYRFV